MKPFIFPLIIVAALIVSCIGYSAYLHNIADEMTELVQKTAGESMYDYRAAGEGISALRDCFEKHRPMLFVLMNHDAPDAIDESISQAEEIFKYGTASELFLCFGDIVRDIDALRDFLPINLSNIM